MDEPQKHRVSACCDALSFEDLTHYLAICHTPVSSNWGAGQPHMYTSPTTTVISLIVGRVIPHHHSISNHCEQFPKLFIHWQVLGWQLSCDGIIYLLHPSQMSPDWCFGCQGWELLISVIQEQVGDVMTEHQGEVSVAGSGVYSTPTLAHEFV